MDPTEPPTPPERAPLVGSPVARRILDLVRRRPGLTTRDVAARLDLAWATVAYHRRRLERDGLLSCVPRGRRLLLYAADVHAEPPAEAADAMLQGQTMRRVALAIQAEPGLDEATLALRLRLPRRALRYHLDRLGSAGLVASLGPARRDAFVPTPLLDLLLGEPPAEAARDDASTRR